MSTSPPPPTVAPVVKLLDRAARECSARGAASSIGDDLTTWYLDAQLVRVASETLRSALPAGMPELPELPELPPFEGPPACIRCRCCSPHRTSSTRSPTSWRTCRYSWAGCDCRPRCPRSAPAMSEPTVGDLLAAADHDARRLLAHAEPQDGPGLAAGYAGVLHAGREVLAAIPDTVVGAPPAHAHRDYLSVRLAQMINQAHSLPPVAVAAHPGMTRIADTWQQAATLIRRYAEPSLAYDPQVWKDAAAARVRVARTLAAAAHVTARELIGYTRQVRQNDRPGQRLPARAIPLPLVARWVRTTQRHEQLTLGYLDGRLSRPADDRGEGHPGIGGDLTSQLATWSALAQRRAVDPAVSSTDLHHIAATQNVILNAAGALAGAALVRGELTTGSGPHLMNRLDAATTQWAAAATVWTWARTPDRPRADPHRINESAALMGAIDRATRTGSSVWASPEQVAERLAHLPAVPILAMNTEMPTRWRRPTSTSRRNWPQPTEFVSQS